MLEIKDLEVWTKEYFEHSTIIDKAKQQYSEVK